MQNKNSSVMPKEMLYFSQNEFFFFEPTVVEVITSLSAEVRDRHSGRLRQVSHQVLQFSFVDKHSNPVPYSYIIQELAQQAHWWLHYQGTRSRPTTRKNKPHYLPMGILCCHGCLPCNSKLEGSLLASIARDIDHHTLFNDANWNIIAKTATMVI